MSRLVKAALLAYAVVALAGCASPDSTTTSADVTLSASPSPANAEPSSGVTYILQGDSNNPDQTLTYPFQSTFTLNMVETGGVKLQITSISLKIQQATGGIITPPTTGEIEHYQFVSSASGNELPAKGEVTVGFQVWYALPNKGRECVATISVGFLDQKGTSDTSDDVGFSKTLDVQIR